MNNVKKWERLHPRRIRGASVHKTFAEKLKRDKDYEEEPSMFLMQMIAKQDAQKPLELTLKSIKKKYTIPTIDNFVETEEVKRIKDKVKFWLNMGYPVHIIGPTGCGKTTIALKVAEELGRPIVWMSGDETMSTADLVGGYSKIETESIRDRFIHTVLKARDEMRAGWVNNPLTVACMYGYTFIYNDFSRARPEANNILLSVFQEGILELPGQFGEERYVRVHPEFRAILTSNSVDYVGVHRPQDALLDRMVGIYMDYYDFYTEVEIVKAHTKISQNEAEKIVAIIRGMREKLPDAEKPGTRACIMVAKGLVNGSRNLKELFIDVLATKTKGPTDLAVKRKFLDEVVESIMRGF